ncbi:esterase/lipase family protein [Arenicella xantha]|uniref:Alpha/beta hydrolase family protein n=1 Tax=Arenicella xantha TaxID=644221 RepID=A0A395JJP6_9GAMM|nr:alpha/beta fold hydrolase [Arenicella xantha]RBP50952.1 alpha/beta hydrolase family protein [Arenicella xantha]
MSLSLFRRAQFRFWRYAEPRAIFEWQSFYALKPLLKRLPKGDGHAVVVFPGFGGSDRSTKPMRKLLSDLGYRSYGWGLGTNLIFDDHLEAEMVALVREVADETGGKVSLVGWSLGGLFAREVAKACPDVVRNVISLGSPISGRTRHSNAHRLFQAINGKPSDLEYTRRLSLSTAPPVPTTSIYSKTDGIVAWEGSIQAESDLAESIQVPASHLGIGVNPLAMYILADRLRQTDMAWRKFSFSGLRKIIFAKPPANVAVANDGARAH